jgi:hypothetical protein
MPNFFRRMLEAGYTIEWVGIERNADDDDDWFLVRFSQEPDPALVGLRPLQGGTAVEKKKASR